MREPEAFSLVIRSSDGKCRGERRGKAITRWLNDGLEVLESVRRKECRK